LKDDEWMNYLKNLTLITEEICRPEHSPEFPEIPEIL